MGFNKKYLLGLLPFLIINCGSAGGTSSTTSSTEGTTTATTVQALLDQGVAVNDLSSTLTGTWSVTSYPTSKTSSSLTVADTDPTVTFTSDTTTTNLVKFTTNGTTVATGSLDATESSDLFDYTVGEYTGDSNMSRASDIGLVMCGDTGGNCSCDSPDDYCVVVDNDTKTEYCEDFIPVNTPYVKTSDNTEILNAQISFTITDPGIGDEIFEINAVGSNYATETCCDTTPGACAAQASSAVEGTKTVTTNYTLKAINDTQMALQSSDAYIILTKQQ